VTPGLVDINLTLGYQSEEAAGTGMVLTSSGEILTNNHVIDGATSISVTDLANSKTYQANVVGYDGSQDIAVLQLVNASGLQTVSLGSSSSVSVGEAVVGIGNAGGTGGTPSAAGGAVTALNQSITATDEGSGSSEQLTGLIGTDADIEAGDSGGPLVNASGQVLGMDTAGSATNDSATTSASSSATIGFAIPIDTALSIVKEITSSESSSTVHIGDTGFLGVGVSTSSAAGGLGSGGLGSGGFGTGSGGFGSGSGGFGSSSGVGSSGSGGSASGSSGSGSASTSGATVVNVVTGSPASEAGIAAGDVITSIDGKTVTSPTTISQILVPHHPGDSVSITWTDTSGTSHTATVKLASGPPA
jgi:S1-C subfamily serine protease